MSRRDSQDAVAAPAGPPPRRDFGVNPLRLVAVLSSGGLGFGDRHQVGSGGKHKRTRAVRADLRDLAPRERVHHAGIPPFLGLLSAP